MQPRSKIPDTQTKEAVFKTLYPEDPAPTFELWIMHISRELDNVKKELKRINSEKEKDLHSIARRVI